MLAIFLTDIPLLMDGTEWEQFVELFFTKYAIRTILIIDLLALVLFFWDRQRQKVITQRERLKAEIERKMAEMKLNALLSQMNPHFIFNSLTSIQHYISINDQESAHNYLAKFAELIRKILENSKKTMVTIEEELQTLTLNIELEALRFSNKFEYVIEVDPEIDDQHTLIPTMLMQPFVENALKHGIMQKKEGKGLLEVRLKLDENDFVFCSIQDNGIGREKAMVLKQKRKVNHQSFGFKDTQERIEILNAQNPNKTSFKVIDLKNDKNEPGGTRIEMYIPIHKHTG